MVIQLRQLITAPLLRLFFYDQTLLLACSPFVFLML
jgi:hypothetical protein